MIKKIDAYLTSYFPIIVASYFIYNNSTFATHIFVVCWLSMVINMSFVLETYQAIFTTKNSLLSILSLLLFGGLALFELISIEGFLLGVIISENAALLMAIVYAFLFKKGMNDENAWNTFGTKSTIGLVLLFLVTIYPYIGEWIVYLIANAEVLVILGAVINFIVNIKRKSEVLQSITNRRKKDPKYAIDKQLERAFNTTKLMPAAVNIIVSLGIWFFGVGIIYAVFVHNA
jgi:hypothetical protein